MTAPRQIVSVETQVAALARTCRTAKAAECTVMTACSVSKAVRRSIIQQDIGMQIGQTNLPFKACGEFVIHQEIRATQQAKQLPLGVT